jgi:CheY-like chemotaxis protein
LILRSEQRAVLIVEDDTALRELYRFALKGAGYAVAAVGDGADALRVIEQHPPRAVVLDLALPRVSGLDVHRELRARPETRHIPVVVVTGTDASSLERSEFIRVLSKPVSPDVVVNAVELSVKKKAGL